MSRCLIVGDQYLEVSILQILDTIKSELGGSKLSYYKQKGEDIRVTCPNPNHKHGQESTPSCGIYVGDDPEKEYGQWNCFTCSEKGSFVHFVALCFEQSDHWAQNWLLKHYGEEIVNPLKDQLQPIDLNAKKNKPRFLSEAILNPMQSWHPYMAKRKLLPKVCEKFKVKYDPKTECLVFPVWDEFGRLYMLTRRSVNNKTFIIDADKEKPVYLLNFIREHNIKEVTIVESQINCLTLWGYGIPSVATFGCKVTPKQMELLKKSGITHIYTAFDPDEAGEKGTANLIKGLSSSSIIDVICLPPGKDVNDLTEEEFDSCPIKNSSDWLHDYKK